MNLSINTERLTHELNELATISDAPPPAVTRVVYSETDRRARGYLHNLFSSAGLHVRTDAVGNTFARWIGAQPELPVIGTGSHIDAIPFAGRYDGTVGVLGGLEAIRALQQSGFQPKRSIELILFTSEEPTRFGIGCLGSRFMSGLLDRNAGERLRDESGKTLNEVRREAGYAGDLSTVRLASDFYHAFLELHIEQGPLLEKGAIPLGIVTAIAAPATLRVTVQGEGGHAGAVLMPDRHDAFCAVAQMALAVEKAALATEATDTVATVGLCNVFPNAVNSIPSRVEFTVDVRDVDRERRDRVLAQIHNACDAAAARRGVGIAIEILNADPPAACDGRVVNTLTNVCHANGIPHQKMVSRAYHDTLFMSAIAPSAMLFIPCRDGVSHRPDEYADPKDMETGTRILAETLAALSVA